MVQVFGTYRTNWTSPQKAKFLERIVRTLWKRGPMTTGQLASYVRQSVQDSLFQQALAALSEWRIIAVTKRPWGIAYVAELVAETTQIGAGLAVELVGERQKQGLPAVEE
jgi:hypothetical protein